MNAPCFSRQVNNNLKKPRFPVTADWRLDSKQWLRPPDIRSAHNTETRDHRRLLFIQELGVHFKSGLTCELFGLRGARFSSLYLV
ncbi:hypothetical protein VZT92_023033 [Zoarces viviparus]|uniref:Uncharacterized protein n=1 Tax=Zoarces viviparus TaxID=48416 RepID=A0AAW1E5X1_ZOAVI